MQLNKEQPLLKFEEYKNLFYYSLKFDTTRAINLYSLLNDYSQSHPYVSKWELAAGHRYVYCYNTPVSLPSGRVLDTLQRKYLKYLQSSYLNS